MKTCIERDVALQIVFDACAECMSTCEEFDGIYADCHQCPLEGVKIKLRDMSVTDVQQTVTAHWVDDAVYEAEDGSLCSGFFCTNCNTPQPIQTRFCPECGAKMETC